MEKFSIKTAAAVGAGALGAFGLAAVFQAAVHLNQGHFDSFAAAFSYVAQPLPLALAAGVSVALGAGTAFIGWYNRSLDREQADQQKPPQLTNAPPATAPAPAKPHA